MVLSRSKHSNAGKAPVRLDEVALDTPPPSAQAKTSKKAFSRSREASIVSQALKSSKKAAPQPTKRLILSIKPQATQLMQPSIRPASSRQEEDISTASPGPEPFLSDDDGSKAAKEDIAPQEEEGELGEKESKIEKIPVLEEEIIAFETYIIELSIVLDRKAIYNCLIKLIKLNFKHFKLDAY
jgi:hypothetical protein